MGRVITHRRVNGRNPVIDHPQPLSEAADGGMEFSRVAQLPTRFGLFHVRAVRVADGRTHLVVYKGDIAGRTDCAVRIHSECRTGEVFHSMRCDCREQLAQALEQFEAEGCGLMIYLRQEGRGIGLFNKIEAYALQDVGLDTITANEALGHVPDARRYDVAVKILNHYAIGSIRLLTNNPAKVAAVEEQGIAVQRVSIVAPSNPFNDQYLTTKRLQMDHLL